MKNTFVRILLISALVLVAGCARPDIPASPEPPAAPATTADPGAAAERTFENDEFILTVPAGWGMSLSGGAYYDLGTEEIVTFYNNPLRIKSDAFLTISAAAPGGGGAVGDCVSTAYATQATAIKDMAQQDYEQGGLTGIEATYRRPWGEPWWQFRDIWLLKDGTCYLLSFHSYPNTFAERADVFDAMLKSFSFKE